MLIERLSFYFNWLDLCQRKNSGNSSKRVYRSISMFFTRPSSRNMIDSTSRNRSAV